LRDAVPNDPNLVHLETLIGCVLDGTPMPWAALVVDAHGRVFALRLQTFASSAVRAGTDIHVAGSSSIHDIGPDLDFMSTLHTVPITLLMAMNAVAHLAVTPRHTIALVSSARDEGISLRR
jgi:hypothetical protein